MKKTSIILAMAAVALGFSSCKQEDDPQYKNPTTFTVNTPALQNNVFRCSEEMTDPETFNLFCSQPDYGYSAICTYSALVTLDEKEAAKGGSDIDESKWIALPNETPSSAAMAIKTFELGAAVNKLLGVVDKDDFDAKGIYDQQFKCYFKAVCEISNIEGSRIVSGNTVSYNNVMIHYAEKKPAWIYICGDVYDKDGQHLNAFTAPSAANEPDYKAYWSLFEPEDMIGEKLYVGTFLLNPKDPANFPGPENNQGEYGIDNPNACAQFRFFTQLGGWSTDYSLGSNEADFYVVKITDKWTAGFSGEIINHGLGNWGIFVPFEEGPKPVTIVVDVPNLKIFVKEGAHDVEFVGRDPEFK